MIVDCSNLSDIDLKLLAQGYARCYYDPSVSRRLQMWAWNLCLALTEELEDRQETLQALQADFDGDGGVGEMVGE